jgi:excisionase family DNA binding protein
MSDTLKRYLSVKQVCEHLPVCKSLVYRLVNEGRLPCARLGGKIMIPLDELQALLEGGDHPQAAPDVQADARPPPAPKKPRRQSERPELW